MKSEILSLSGFKKYTNLTLRQLKPLLKKSIKVLGIEVRGVRLRDYVKRIKEIEEAQKKSDENYLREFLLLKKILRNSSKVVSNINRP